MRVDGACLGMWVAGGWCERGFSRLSRLVNGVVEERERWPAAGKEYNCAVSSTCKDEERWAGPSLPRMDTSL
jgi:hypothetical protein